MYTGLQYQVSANGSTAPPFRVGIGVKQGCPLSPILYNLYVHPISTALGGLGVGPTFPGVAGCQPDYHYADDVALVAESVADLQALLVHIVAALAARDLKLSVSKCVGLVLGMQPPPGPPPAITIEGQPLRWSDDTGGERYLGLMFDLAASAGSMAAHRAGCFNSAFYATTSDMKAAPDFPTAVPTFLKLLHTVMEPAGLYGCELWGLLSLPGLHAQASFTLDRFYALSDPLEARRCSLLRQWLKLPVSVPKLALLHELGCEPLSHLYVKRAVRFYNDLLDLPEASTYRGVLRQNVADAFDAWHSASRAATRPCNFVRALFQVLRILLPSERGLVARFRGEQPFDASDVDAALLARYQQHVTSKAAIQEGKGSRLGLYFREVASHALGDVPQYFSLRVSHGPMTRCLRFRLGCHHLRIHTGRWQQPRLPRRACVCIRCSLNVVDDEAHCLFACTHPTLQQQREQLRAALRLQGVVQFDSLRTYKQFWQAMDSCGSPQLVYYLATCVRVAWHYHTSGPAMPASPVVMDEYLDLFDDESDLDASEHMLSDYSDGEELIEVFSSDDPVPAGSE